MLKDYEFDDDNKSDELQNDGEVMMEKFSSIAKSTRVTCCIKTRKATPGILSDWRVEDISISETPNRP